MSRDLFADDEIAEVATTAPSAEGRDLLAEEQPLPQEELLKSLSGTSIADVASEYGEVISAPIAQAIGAIGGKIAGGYETLAKAPFTGIEEAITEGQQTEQAVSSAFEPISDIGKQSSDVVFSALAHANKIPAGWGGIAELIETQDPEKAANVIKQVEEKGLPQYMGDLNFEAYGSPLLATMTTTIPEMAALFMPVSKSINTGKINKARKDLELIDQIESNTSGRNLAEYKLQNRDEWSKPSEAEVNVLSEKLQVDKEFAMEMAEAMPTISKKKSFKEANNQEWDQSLLGLIQASSKNDVGVMERMLTIYDKARNNMDLKATKRPIFESGKAINDRVKFLVGKKSEAGKRVGAAAESLRGVAVDYAPVVDKFINNLVNDGVVINGGKPITHVSQYNKLDFRNSPYDGSKASEDLLRKQIKRMTAKDFDLDGFNLHTTKQNLPHQITTAKKSEGGLVPKAETLLSNLRRDINDSLRNVSDDYRSANDDFRQAIEPLNELNDAMPRNAQVDWDGINEKNAGLQTRKVLSNYGNGADLAEAIKGIDRVSIELGGKFNSDAIKQAMFAIGLDKRLGAFADTSLEGVMNSSASNTMNSIPTGALDAVIKTVGAVARKTKKIDNDRAIKAMREYLKESKQGK